MKKKHIFIFALLLCLSIVTLTIYPCAQIVEASDKVSPSKPSIGYCEGEDYYEFRYQLYYLLCGMEERGLISGVREATTISKDSSSREIWNYACNLNQSNWAVRLMPEAFRNLTEEGTAPLSEEQSEKLVDSVTLWITMGTTAGLYVKEWTPDTDCMNFMSADPVNAGIVKDSEYSGEKHIWAHLDPDNFSRTLAIMDDMFQPKSVGLIYANREDAYIYSGAIAVDDYCNQYKIAVKAAYVEDEFEEGDYENYKNEMRKAAEELAEKIDVFLMTTSLLKPEDYAWTLEPFYKRNIPVYSINSVDDVSHDAMMASESADYEQIGLFGGNAISEYLDGNSLDEIPQIYITAPCLYINYDVCRRISFSVPFKQLIGAVIITE